MKKFINPFEYAVHFTNNMKPGILLTTKSGDFVNTMTIGWGTIGIEWGKPIFVAYVRESRHTRQMLDNNPEFTVNCPYGNVDTKLIGFCGTKSGRDVDKIQQLNLHLEDPVSISVPGIRELPLTLECKVLYRNAQPTAGIPEEILNHYYPEVNGSRDYHIAYYGEIVSAYLIADEE